MGAGAELEWCIVRPGGLKSEPPTGVVTAGKDQEAGAITRADVRGGALQPEQPHHSGSPLLIVVHPLLTGGAVQPEQTHHSGTPLLIVVHPLLTGGAVKLIIVVHPSL